MIPTKANQKDWVNRAIPRKIKLNRSETPQKIAGTAIIIRFSSEKRVKPD
jgi:hypothetical protein